MANLARRIGEFADKVIGERADVIGYSFGGWLGTWLTVLQPDSVGQLVLEAPAGFRPEGMGDLASDPEQQQRRRLYAHPEKAPPEEKPAAVGARNREMLRNYQGPASIDTELVERLGEIEALTLILHGTNDGAIPVESPRLLKNRIPRAFLIYVYDAAHAPEIDQPEYFVDVVDDFLKRGEVFLVNPGAGEAAE